MAHWFCKNERHSATTQGGSWSSVLWSSLSAGWKSAHLNPAAHRETKQVWVWTVTVQEKYVQKFYASQSCLLTWVIWTAHKRISVTFTQNVSQLSSDASEKRTRCETAFNTLKDTVLPHKRVFLFPGSLLPHKWELKFSSFLTTCYCTRKLKSLWFLAVFLPAADQLWQILQETRITFRFTHFHQASINISQIIFRGFPTRMVYLKHDK